MKSYYKQVIDITQNYLGPASKRFVDRQISFHFDKNPEDIDRQDLPKIASSVSVAIGMLTQDKKMSADVESKIIALGV